MTLQVIIDEKLQATGSSSCFNAGMYHHKKFDEAGLQAISGVVIIEDSTYYTSIRFNYSPYFDDGEIDCLDSATRFIVKAAVINYCIWLARDKY